MNRNELAVKSSAVGMLYQLVSIITKFLTRTLAIRIFGIEILGLDNVLIDMINMFTLVSASLEFVMLYRLYSPISNNDETTISKYAAVCKYIYIRVGVLLLFGGIILSCLLPIIIKNVDFPLIYIYIAYYLQLINTVLLCELGYMRVLLNAAQKKYLCMLIDMLTTILFCIFKAITIICWKNYLVYLMLSILQTILSNSILWKYVKKKYSFVVWNQKDIMGDVKEVLSDAKDALADGISNCVYGSVDSIVISAMVGTNLVGMLSNYKYISTTLLHVVYNTLISIQPIVGNYLNSNKNPIDTYRILKRYTYIRFLIVGISLVEFIVLADTFVLLWTGGEGYLMPISITILLGMDYYMVCVYYPLYEYVLSLGLFKYGKYVSTIGATANLTLSILGVFYLGVKGALIATAVTQLIMWSGYIYVVFTKIYSSNFKFIYDYIWINIRYIVSIVISVGISYGLYTLNMSKSLYVKFATGAMVSLIVCLLVNFVFFAKTDEFGFVRNITIKLIKK